MSNGPIAAEQLRLFLERIERLNEEAKSLKLDIKDVFNEAKMLGFDPKIMREILKLRAMDTDTRREREALIDTYKAALGMLDGTPLGNWAVQKITKAQSPPPEEGDQPNDAPADAPEDPETPAPPPITVDDARRMGTEAAHAGGPVTSNPFQACDERRAAWDEAWCAVLGSDGMDIPDVWKRQPKKKPDEKGGEQ